MKKLTLSILIFLLSISFVACSSANTPRKVLLLRKVLTVIQAIMLQVTIAVLQTTILIQGKILHLTILHLRLA
ncbi:hypothetical protein DWX71_10330 [Ruminococcus bromii]|nr:hypothetical protein DWX71_10330 [Ruminococcus bromii]